MGGTEFDLEHNLTLSGATLSILNKCANPNTIVIKTTKGTVEKETVENKLTSKFSFILKQPLSTLINIFFTLFDEKFITEVSICSKFIFFLVLKDSCCHQLPLL